ncbi:bifunctional PGK/TIM [bacterium BMS3Bbin04]|nr:bifunctional PGK/TIM [bacterium BMS3Bbin04]
MRTPLIAGNWKMNLLRAEASALTEAIVTTTSQTNGVEVLLCPPFVLLDTVRAAIGDSDVELGAQHLYSEPSGAYTGEISATMLVDAGCKFVVIGHSERRQFFGETDASVRHKIKAALDAGLTPVVCVGETLEEREDGSTPKVIERQVSVALERFKPEEVAKMVIAYEPVWAIGTGKTATPETAQEVHAFIRNLISKSVDKQVAKGIRIIYGGSMKAANADELLAQTDIDGGLIGGASLKAEEFSAIIKAAS